jgi:hypothetical protein
MSVLIKIRRWQWILIGLLVGFAVGYVRRMPRGDWAEAYGQSIGPGEFEYAISHDFMGSARFINMVVYADQVDDVDGRRRPVHVVVGSYCSGQTRVVNGQKEPIRVTRCVIAEIPYRPLSGTSHSTAADFTVMNYLDTLRKSGRPIAYRHAFWCDPRWAVPAWVAGSVLVIGVLWPTLINLLVFGSIFRPREEKGIDLSKVKATSTEAQRAPLVTEDDLAKVEQLDAKLEAQLMENAPSGALPAPGSTSSQTPVKQLTATKLELTAVEQAKEQKDFGADKDDYYPTERHAHHVDPGKTTGGDAGTS